MGLMASFRGGSFMPSQSQKKCLCRSSSSSSSSSSKVGVRRRAGSSSTSTSRGFFATGAPCPRRRRHSCGTRVVPVVPVKTPPRSSQQQQASFSSSSSSSSTAGGSGGEGWMKSMKGSSSSIQKRIQHQQQQRLDPKDTYREDRAILTHAARSGRSSSIENERVIAAIERRAKSNDLEHLMEEKIAAAEHAEEEVPFVDDCEIEGVWRLVFTYGPKYPPKFMQYLPINEDFVLAPDGFAAIETDLAGPMFIRFVGKWERELHSGTPTSSRREDDDRPAVSYTFDEQQLCLGKHAREVDGKKSLIGHHEPRVLLRSPITPRKTTKYVFEDYWRDDDGTRIAIARNASEQDGNHTLMRELLDD